MDISHPNSFLQQEEYRLTTFSEHETSPIDTTRVYRNMPFVSYDCLRYEEKRLGTFIDWPHEWLKPSELAADGFYYLRKDDHCACIFCRGIVGAWEKTDTPRGEHERHFPHCPFIRGQPTGNVPIVQGNILARLPVLHASLDDCGSRRVEADACRFSSRHMAGSYPECSEWFGIFYRWLVFMNTVSNSLTPWAQSRFIPCYRFVSQEDLRMKLVSTSILDRNEVISRH